jgi:hypothetical protein
MSSMNPERAQDLVNERLNEVQRQTSASFKTKRTGIDNCADSLDYLRVKIREAYAHGELDATGYARVQERIDWVDAYLEMRNEINKDV